MATIFIDSIRAAVTQGKLIDLAGDYRTSRSIRACLPRDNSYSFAISIAAYNQEVEQGTTRNRQARLDVIGAFLTKVGLSKNPQPADLELRFPGETGKSLDPSLKLVWFPSDKYWVILLPHEQLRSALKLN